MRIYLSHPIRGKNQDSSPEYLFNNNLKARNMADKIRELGATVYCPAEHEEFVQLAHDAKFLSVEQILAIDCKIIDRCDVVIFYNHEEVFSNGMKVEYLHTVATNKPCYMFFQEFNEEELKAWLASL